MLYVNCPFSRGHTLYCKSIRISTSVEMIISGLDSAMVIMSGRGLLIRTKDRNDYTELPEPIYMPGTLVSFTLPVQKEGFTIYDYIGG